jgi:hypothetical protein
MPRVSEDKIEGRMDTDVRRWEEGEFNAGAETRRIGGGRRETRSLPGANVFPGKKFSPPRPNGREGLMFPPEQFLNLLKVIRHRIGGRNNFL